MRCAVLWATGQRYAFWQNVDNCRKCASAPRRSSPRSTCRRAATCRPGVLTYAEQRALEIGITIAGGADVILLDEPTAGMSHAETERAVELIRRVTEGRTLVIVEHDMSVVFGLADRISVLVYGQIIATGTPEEIRGNPKVKEAYLGEEAALMLEVQRSARLLRQEPHPAGRRYRCRRGRGGEPARPQRRRPLDHGQGDHGRGAAAGLDPVQGQRHRRPAELPDRASRARLRAREPRHLPRR